MRRMGPIVVCVCVCVCVWVIRIESWWGRYIPHTSRVALGPTQPPVQLVPSLSRGLKWTGRGVDYPLLSSSEVKERLVLYL